MYHALPDMTNLLYSFIIEKKVNERAVLISTVRSTQNACIKNCVYGNENHWLQVEKQYELTSNPWSSCLQLHMYQKMAQSAITGKSAHWTCKLYMPQYRGTPGTKSGSRWVGEWGEGMGDFWDSIGNINEENT